MNPLTRPQRDTLRFLYWFRERHGYMPTLREMSAGFGLKSTNGTNDRLAGLERKGCIIRNKMLSRAIQITDRGMQALGRLDDPWPFFDVEKSA